MTNIIYRDIKCPYCGSRQRVPYYVTSGLNENMYHVDLDFSIKITKCFDCKESFKPFVNIEFGAKQFKFKKED